MDAEPSTSDLSEASSVSITLEATLEGHTDRAWCVAWEPQGRFLATCSSDRTARLWAPSRAAGGAWVTVAELEGVHNRTVRSVAWSPCGTSARRADPRETYLFPFSPSRSLRVPAALRRFFREERPFVFRKTKRPTTRFAFRVSLARAPATLTFTITKKLFRRPHARDGFFRRVHRGVGRARRGLGVRRRGGGARKRGQVVRLVAQRRAPGDVRPRQDGVDLGGPARVRLRVRRGAARARAGREAGALAPNRGRAGVGVLRRRDPRVGGRTRRRRLVVRARVVGEGRGAHQHGLERGVRGVARSDGRPKRRAEDGDVLGRQEHRRVGRERCAARPRDLKTRRFWFFWFFWFFCSRDGKRTRRAKPRRWSDGRVGRAPDAPGST